MLELKSTFAVHVSEPAAAVVKRLRHEVRTTTNSPREWLDVPVRFVGTVTVNAFQLYRRRPGGLMGEGLRVSGTITPTQCGTTRVDVEIRVPGVYVYGVIATTALMAGLVVHLLLSPVPPASNVVYGGAGFMIAGAWASLAFLCADAPRLRATLTAILDGSFVIPR